MLKRVSKKVLYLKYMATFLLPVVITLLLTLLSGYYLNNFVREKNTRISENIARQLCADINKIVEETDMMMISYTTNLNFFERLGSILGKADLSYEELRVLQFCQDTLDISAKVHPYIYSVYCLPFTERSDSILMVSFDGVFRLDSFPDRSFISSVLDNTEDKGVVMRNYQSGSLPEIPILSKYALVKSADHTRTKGILIVNLEMKYIESMLNSRIRERTDNLFLVSWPQGIPVFASTELKNLGSDKMKEILLQVEAGHTVKLPASNITKESGAQKMVEYLPITGIISQYGFSVHLMASRDSLYATSENLVAVNIAVILISIIIGIAIIILITEKRYNDIIKVGDYIDALDEVGSLTSTLPQTIDGLSTAASKMYPLKEYLRLHLSERELKERKLELQLLRSQLNPHFLLNTLQMLNWKIMREFNGYGDLNSIIEDLCKILSYSLYSAESLAPLSEEIRYTNSYMALQGHIKNSSIKIVWEIDDSKMQYMVPRLLFQPIIENAQKHAFISTSSESEHESPDVSAEPHITVRFEQRYGNLYIHVNDNGCGMDRKTLEQVRESLSMESAKTSGIGLSNTHKRIQLLFGRKFGVSVNSVIGKGTEVVMVIPILIKQQ